VSIIMLGRSAGLPRSPTHPHLAADLEAFYHHVSLGLILEEGPKEPLLLGLTLVDPLQAALHQTLDVSGIECQTEIEEELAVVGVVVAGKRRGCGLYRSPSSTPPFGAF
jgi:hypothetical protein